ncbi:aldo/keto reductase [Leptospira langatensis]|uniref:Aldo/keto reductase n=1 Tax=Leptospira langatensis TaxID=2484983 RepID=A0A5F1ZVG6_9LEPT|nr:aldo/keto reductase [Leptospira langatensis]TGK01291.1 aldo/keto reductase [Leptospira langatensis]TGL42256.1 aldo/keto reductase [Leptospira langatensis]
MGSKYTRKDFLNRLAASFVGTAMVDSFYRPLFTQTTGVARMLKRRIPKTGEEIPAIGLGTWQTLDVDPDPSSLAPLKEVLSEFLNTGGGIVDSSPMYGRSEEIFGILSKDIPEKEKRKFFLATKVWTRGEAAGKAQIEASFRKMKADKIDLFQIHNLLDTQTHLKTLRDLKDRAKIRYIGLTHFTSSAFPEMEKISIKEKPDFLQIPYSVITREAEQRILPFALENGIAVLVNRPFEEGGLFRKAKGKTLPDYFKEWDCNSFAQAFLKYLLSHPGVTAVIPATSKVSHLKDNMQAGLGRFPDAKERKVFLSNLLEALD